MKKSTKLSHPKPDPLKTIMYIDDDPIDSWLAAQVIEKSALFLEFKAASNGKQGFDLIIDFYRKEGKLPEVVIVDLIMPLMNGFELINAIKQLPFYSEKDTSLILISEGYDIADLHKIENLEIKNVLIKPIEELEIIKLLK